MFNIGFTNLNGIDIETVVDLKNINSIVFYSEFNLYKRNRLVTGCHDFLNISNSSRFIFRLKSPIEKNFNLYFLNTNNKYPICSLFFRNALIYILSLFFMVNSYFVKNVVSFSDPTWKINNNLKY